MITRSANRKDKEPISYNETVLSTLALKKSEAECQLLTPRSKKSHRKNSSKSVTQPVVNVYINLPPTLVDPLQKNSNTPVIQLPAIQPVVHVHFDEVTKNNGSSEDSQLKSILYESLKSQDFNKLLSYLSPESENVRRNSETSFSTVPDTSFNIFSPSKCSTQILHESSKTEISSVDNNLLANNSQLTCKNGKEIAENIGKFFDINTPKSPKTSKIGKHDSEQSSKASGLNVTQCTPVCADKNECEANDVNETPKESNLSSKFKDCLKIIEKMSVFSEDEKLSKLKPVLVLRDFRKNNGIDSVSEIKKTEKSEVIVNKFLNIGKRKNGQEADDEASEVRNTTEFVQPLCKIPGKSDSSTLVSSKVNVMSQNHNISSDSSSPSKRKSVDLINGSEKSSLPETPKTSHCTRKSKSKAASLSPNELRDPKTDFTKSISTDDEVLLSLPKKNGNVYSAVYESDYEEVSNEKNGLASVTEGCNFSEILKKIQKKKYRSQILDFANHKRRLSMSEVLEKEKPVSEENVQSEKEESLFEQNNENNSFSENEDVEGTAKLIKKSGFSRIIQKKINEVVETLNKSDSLDVPISFPEVNNTTLKGSSKKEIVVTTKKKNKSKLPDHDTIRFFMNHNEDITNEKKNSVFLNKNIFEISKNLNQSDSNDASFKLNEPKDKTLQEEESEEKQGCTPKKKKSETKEYNKNNIEDDCIGHITNGIKNSGSSSKEKTIEMIKNIHESYNCDISGSANESKDKIVDKPETDIDPKKKNKSKNKKSNKSKSENDYSENSINGMKNCGFTNEAVEPTVNINKNINDSDSCATSISSFNSKETTLMEISEFEIEKTKSETEEGDKSKFENGHSGKIKEIKTGFLKKIKEKKIEDNKNIDESDGNDTSVSSDTVKYTNATEYSSLSEEEVISPKKKKMSETRECNKSETESSDSDSQSSATDNEKNLSMEISAEKIGEAFDEISDLESLCEKLNDIQKGHLKSSVNGRKLLDVETPDIQLECIKKEMARRGFFEKPDKKKKSKKKKRKLQNLKSTAKTSPAPPPKKVKVPKAEEVKKTPKQKNFLPSDYIPLNVEGPTKFAVAPLTKVKGYEKHKAMNFKEKMLFGDRVHRFSGNKDLQILKLKRQARKPY